MRDPLISVETKIGSPIYAGRFKIIPFSKVLYIRFPIIHGGLIWNRPASILVTAEDEQEQLYPIPDTTRIALWSLLTLGIFGTLLFSWIGLRKERKSQHE
jgi:hypothetical protein